MGSTLSGRENPDADVRTPHLTPPPHAQKKAATEVAALLLREAQYSTIGLPGEPVAPMIRSGAQMNAPS